MKDNIKKLIYDIISERTKSTDLREYNSFSAMNLSEKFKSSRNLISQYLNEYSDSGIFVKLNTRPVAFYSKQDLCKNYKFLDNEYESFERLQNAIKKADSYSAAFDELIGNRGSLQFAVQQCKSSITYPKTGLPMLLLGPTGVGKSFLVQMMFEYGLEKKIFDENSRFIIVNCSEYANNPEFFLTNIFGCKKGAYTGADKDREGLISLANKGMLFLDEVHCLSPECQEKLFLFMDKGIYHMVGDNDKWYNAQEHLVFATTENPQKALLKTLYRRIPIVANIPALTERPIQEKKEIIIYFLKKEAENLNKKIFISHRLFSTFVDFDFSENVGQLLNCIKACIANAYVEMSDYNTEKIELDIENLPNYIIQSITNDKKILYYNDDKMMSLEDLVVEQKEESKLYLYNRDLIDLFKSKDCNKNFDEFFEICKKRFEEYLNELCFYNGSANQSQELLYYSLIQNVCDEISNRYNVKINNNEVVNISKLLNDYNCNINTCSEIITNESIMINKFIKYFVDNDQECYSIANELMNCFRKILKFDNRDLGLLNTIIFSKVLFFKENSNPVRCMILAHGYSTASSLANCVNTMVGTTIFDSIDMPLNINIYIIIEKLTEYITRKKSLEELIVLVDMGSLEEIYENIASYTNINIVMFNNVTIKMALDIALKILQQEPILDIKNDIDNQDYSSKSIYIESKNKEKAIISICSTGILMAEKICTLIKMSLPTKSSIKVVSYNYESIKENGTRALIFDKFDVKLIVGNIDPNLEKYTFISIDEMIEKKNIKKLEQIIGEVFTQQEFELFSKNIIKNFSLQNIINYLTIINPEKILNYVEKIVIIIQRNLNITMSGNTIVGLYIHISCLIERLITDKYITKYNDIDIFVKKEQKFIKVVKNAFKELESKYAVEIPVSEIAYIFDYIYQKNNGKRDNYTVEKILNTVENNEF